MLMCGFLFQKSSVIHKKSVVRFILFVLLCINHVNSSLLIGALFGADTVRNGSHIIESDEEIVFKHAVYISNQYKISYLNEPSHHSTLLHKIIHIPRLEQVQTIKKVCKEINGNMVALVGPSDDIMQLYIKSLSEELNLIHFDIEPKLYNTYSFNLFPSLDVLCLGYADLVKKFEWKHLAIIYNSKTNLEKIRCLLGGPGTLMPKLDLTLKIANYVYEYRSILRDLSKRRITNIIIDLEPSETQIFLKTALQSGMINSTYQYIITTLDVETIDLEDFKYNKANITAFRIVKADSSFHKYITYNLTDYYNNNWKEHGKNRVLLTTRNALMFDSIFAFSAAIKEASKSLNLNEGHVSCVNDRPLEIGSLLPHYVEKISVQGLTGLINFQNRERREFSLDVLQLKETGLFKCGDWSPTKGLNFTFYDEVYREDTSLSRKTPLRVVTLVPRVEQSLVLKVTTKIEEPYVMEEDGQFRGFCIDILDEIAKKMNFRYEIYRVADNQYGIEDENGSWNGMIRELNEKKADLAISAFTINFKRQQVVDFTKPFISLGISILYKIPTSKKPGLFSFLNPLSLEIWIYTLITYILVSLIMMVLARFSPYEWRSTHPCNQNNDYVENQFTAWNSLWFAVGTLMQQGSDINPKALSTRLVGGVWWFFTLIIISSYTANLAAFLTVEKVDLTITNAEELANQTKTKYGIFKGGSTMNFFKESRIDTYKRMWQQMQNHPEVSFVKSNKEGIDRVLTKDYAYLMESPLIDYEIQRNCNLTQIGGLLDSKGYGIATQQGSPYTEEISLKILEMQERGDIQKFYNKWWKSGGTCIRDEKKDSKANALNVENVGGIFVVLVGGLILAVIVSIVEFVYYARKNSARINKPLLSQMFDEFKFAIKCGGSAKKIQTNVHVLSLREELQQQLKSNSTGNLQNSIKRRSQQQTQLEESNHQRSLESKQVFEQHKSQAQREKELSQQRQRKMSTKDSVSYLSSSNNGLPEALETHQALLSAHVASSHNLQQQQSHPKQHHHHSKHSSHYSSSKGPKKKSRHHGASGSYTHQDETDYILMRPMTSGKSNVLNNHQSQRAHSSERKSIVGSSHNIPINIDQETYYDHALNQQQEQQINFDRYLSKSQILMKQNSNSSNNNLSRSNNRYV